MAQITGMDKYKFRRALEEIETAQGRGTELVTVYVPPERPISDVTNYLRGELSQSSNIKSASTRKHVTQAIESAMQRLKGYRMPPANGLVVFTGHVSVGADQTKMVSYILEPPEPVASFLYRCDSKFYTEPLHEMLAEKDVYGLVVIDWSEATIGVLRGKRIEVIKNLQSQVPSKHRMGGQSARRFERGHDIAVHEWYKKIGDLMTEAFLSRPELKSIIIGGPGYSKEEFATQDYLHHELKKKVLPTFLDTGYTDEYGLRELVEKAREILTGLDLMREKDLVQRLMNEIRKEEGGLAAYGEDQVRHALGLGAVDTLLVSEGLRKVRAKLRCANGDWEGEKTLAPDADPPACPKDGGTVTVVESRDLIEDLSKVAEQMGTNLELISNDSEEGQLLLRAFGGVAAILRYRVT
jgi:peptide chain release factor subunit 1